jgi:FkbM family methyltransferase
MRGLLLSLLARVELQPLWRTVHRAAIAGLGHMNPEARWNGEDRHLHEWGDGLARAGRTRPVVLDVGANEGDFTAAVLAAAPQAEVHCFEPHPATCARLAARFAGEPRVVVQQKGVAEAPRVQVLHDYAGGSGSAHASFVPEVFRDVYVSPTDGVEVALTTVDDYVRERSIERLDLVKVDVEGYEREVLDGMRGVLDAGRVDRIQLEFNAHHALTGFTLHQLGERLPAFDVYKLLANGTERVLGRGVAYNARIEIYKYANYVAVRRST